MYEGAEARAPRYFQQDKRQTPSHPFGSSAIVGSFVACEDGVAEEARTRGFAPPAFTGFAFVGCEALTHIALRQSGVKVARRPAAEL